MIVLRVQHCETGRGPYDSWGPGFHSRTDCPIDSTGHPAPRLDLLMGSKWEKTSTLERKEYIFGFELLEQLFRWFYTDRILEFLTNRDQIIAYYNVRANYVMLGDKQLCFNKDKAQLVDKKYLTSVSVNAMT